MIKKEKLFHEMTDIAFILPAMAFFIFAIIVPFIWGVRTSFSDWDGISSTSKYVGLDNFIRLFTSNDTLLPISNTLLFTVLDVILVNLAGLLMALAVNHGFKGVHMIRTIFFMPIIISIVLSGYIWTYIYLYIFPALGFHGLLGDSSTVIFGLVIVSIWRDSGFAMIIYYAALRSIPIEFLEAVYIDGANALQRLRYITLPMIVPAFTINLSLFLGWALKVFELPLVLTSGGPGRSSESFAIYVYKYAFKYNEVGYGQASALLMMAIVFALSASVTAILRKKEMEA